MSVAAASGSNGVTEVDWQSALCDRSISGVMNQTETIPRFTELTRRLSLLSSEQLSRPTWQAAAAVPSRIPHCDGDNKHLWVAYPLSVTVTL